MAIHTARNHSLATLALVASLAVADASLVRAAMPGDSLGHVVANATVLSRSDAASGALPGVEPMHIVVALRMRNPDALERAVATRRLLTPARFLDAHAPTRVQAQTVANYLGLMGFTNITISPNRMLVSAYGTADTAKAAFLTSFVRVKTAEGRMSYANSSPARVPNLLQDSVLSVLGLQEVHRVRTFAQRVQPYPTPADAQISGHNPLEFSSIYGGTGVPTAAGVTIGIITQGNLAQTITDLNTFTAANGLPTVVTQTVDTNGTGGDTSNVNEWNLDSQSVVGMGGGRVGKLIFYNTPSLQFTDLVANFNTIMSANATKIINVSLGSCELFARNDGSAAAANQILQAAVAQGQTFVVSTGDFGADECRNGGSTPSWPASSPYVVAAAGTMLNATATTWLGEVVWNDKPSYGSTGGSPSTFQPKPLWQNAVVPGTTRGVADIAFSASPFTGAHVVYYGRIAQIGGTSLSAPIFAGMWARVLAVKGSNIGFAAPLLYALPAADFHDVVYGNNSNYGASNGYTAKPGYDFASGLGSLILNRAINHLGGGQAGNTAPVASFRYTVVGLVVSFTDTSTDADGSIVARSWSFGDGGRSTAINPRRVYARAGNYQVTETVTDNGGLTNSYTAMVAVGAR